MKDQLIVVTGAGGFIGGNLVAALRRQATRKYEPSISSHSTSVPAGSEMSRISA